MLEACPAQPGSPQNGVGSCLPGKILHGPLVSLLFPEISLRKSLLLALLSLQDLSSVVTQAVATGGSGWSQEIHVLEPALEASLRQE